jgi:GT2 family glycosyltransferase
MTGWDRMSERRVDVISGAAMFVRRAAMEEVGLLDEAFFFYGEETDWCHRFRLAGWDLVFSPIPRSRISVAARCAS